MKSLAILICVPLFVYATPPMPTKTFRAIVMTDGQKVYPEGHIASKPQVDAVTARTDTVDATVTAQATTINTLTAEIDTLTEQVEDVGSSGVWWLQTYVNSIGILGGLPPYAGDIQIVDVAFTTSNVTLTLWCSVAPVSASQLGVMGTQAIGTDFTSKDFVCSFPVTVPNPENRPTGVCYTYTAPLATDRFWKIVAQEGSLSGENTGLPIYGGVTVNGSAGQTVTIIADDGTELVFKGGILVDPTPVTLDRGTP